jgi:hypothetical protein
MILLVKYRIGIRYPLTGLLDMDGLQDNADSYTK